MQPEVSDLLQSETSWRIATEWRDQSDYVLSGVGDDDFGDDDGSPDGEPSSASTAQFGLWMFLATVVMLFAGFTSAILVRRESSDWHALAVPSLLWLNTAWLVLSSVTMERVRALARRGASSSLNGSLNRWMLATVALGLLFLLGQVGAWRQLWAQGVFLPSNPHASFFYILTGVHGAHLLGGIGALGYLFSRVLSRRSLMLSPTTVNLCATYWHFVGGLWCYLFVVLFVL